MVRRYRRTREYIQVLKKYFTEDQFTHEGEFFTLKDASLFPKPRVSTENLFWWSV